MKATLSQLEELQASLPITVPKQKPVYNGCLTEAQRKLMADIYKEAGISKISKNPARKFNKYRPEF